MAFDQTAYLVGLVAGLITVIGLFGGMKVLVATLGESPMSRFERYVRYTVSALLLGGQLVVALVSLHFWSEAREHPLWLGLGMVSAIFGGSLGIQAWTQFRK